MLAIRVVQDLGQSEFGGVPAFCKACRRVRDKVAELSTRHASIFASKQLCSSMISESEARMCKESSKHGNSSVLARSVSFKYRRGR